MYFPIKLPTAPQKYELRPVAGIDDFVVLPLAAGNEYVLTGQAETIVGSAGDDTFIAHRFNLDRNDELYGGKGNDSLRLIEGGQFHVDYLTVFSSIETILGSSADDIIYTLASQLGDVRRIEGGGGRDRLAAYGPVVDLTGKTIAGFESIYVSEAVVTIDDKNTAFLLTAQNSRGDKVVLTQGILSTADRRELHMNGFETVEGKNAAGETVVTHTEPQLRNLNGDRGSFNRDQPSFIDAGRNAIVDSVLNPWLFAAHLWEDEGFPTQGKFGLDTSAGSGITLSEERTASGRAVYVDGILVAQMTTLDEKLSLGIEFEFNSDAGTPAVLQKLIRAITYSNSQDAITDAFHIELYLVDEFANETEVTVTLDPSLPPPDHRPTAIALSRTSVDEMANSGMAIGLLSTLDPDDGETFTYALLDDAGGRFAIIGNMLVVANGALLDYEAATSHAITIRVTDSTGLTHNQNFSIAVQDVAEGSTPTQAEKPTPIIVGTARSERLTGSAGADEIWAGAGNDIVFGGSGDDRLHGGHGRDTLAGQTGKDVFVFDTSIARKKNVNIDTIADFIPRHDRIELNDSVFKTLKVGSLRKQAFWKGAVAHDSSDRILYNAKTGELFYDDDGTGSHTAIKFAVLRNKPKSFSEKDIFII